MQTALIIDTNVITVIKQTFVWYGNDGITPRTVEIPEHTPMLYIGGFKKTATQGEPIALFELQTDVGVIKSGTTVTLGIALVNETFITVGNFELI